MAMALETASNATMIAVAGSVRAFHLLCLFYLSAADAILTKALRPVPMRGHGGIASLRNIWHSDAAVALGLYGNQPVFVSGGIGI
jgi:hypothetical protein